MNGRRWAVLALLLLLLVPRPAAAENETQTDLSLSDGVAHWMDGVDWTELERLKSGLPDEVRALWNGASLRQSTESYALSGTFGTGDFWSGMLLPMLRRLLLAERGRLAGTLFTLLGLALLGGLSVALAGGEEGGAGGAAAFVCRCFTLTVVLGTFASCASVATGCMGALCDCMTAVTPVLMTLLTALGGVASVGVFQPAMALLCEGVAGVLQGVVAPLALCSGVLAMFDRLSERVRLSELSELIKSAVKWVLGLMTTLYIGVTTLSGMTAAASDGVSVRAARYAAGSLFPSVGGLVTGSFDTVVGCAGLVKNAAGMTAVALCAATLLSPLFRIAATMLLLRITAAVSEPIAEKQQCGMLRAGADMLSMLLAGVAAVGGMFMVTVGLITGLGNAGYL